MADGELSWFFKASVSCYWIWCHCTRHNGKTKQMRCTPFMHWNNTFSILLKYNDPQTSWGELLNSRQQVGCVIIDFLSSLGYKCLIYKCANITLKTTNCRETTMLWRKEHLKLQSKTLKLMLHPFYLSYNW